MRLIHISHYDEQTMQLAKPVFDSKRRILLAANHTIHPKYLERLIQIGVRTLIVEDAESRGITLEEMMDMPTWMDITAIVQEAFEAAKAKKTLPVKNLLAAAGRLLVEVQRRPVILPIPVTTIAEELKLYAHSVNVALLSLQVGKKLGYNELQLRDLIVGCLLHDIGKALTDEGPAHPEAGFNLLRSIREINLLSAHIAFQHHESMDGKGYPRGIRGSDFHEFAQICAVCNLYENQLASDVPPHDTMELVMSLSERVYAVHIISAFVQTVPAYPPGTKIRLQNGEDAIVTKIAGHMQRPVIRYMSSGNEISLADNPTVMIAGCC